MERQERFRYLIAQTIEQAQFGYQFESVLGAVQ
jgi:hypothetical protein